VDPEVHATAERELSATNHGSSTPQLVTNSQPLGTLRRKAAAAQLTFINSASLFGDGPRAEHGAIEGFSQNQHETNTS
jgi:hypothetical protein